ncbi:MAG: helix-turn-helix domain-containing protein [Bacilli bacterium]|jgi:transcriptional regulator with XRE-family HTH domain|nr:helix-turn-helix domain-containing protein [Bacilli bacterium]
MAKNTDIKAVVSNNLVRFRKEAKLTQTQAAEKINYSDKAISKWERGESLPDVYVLKQIADVYGVELDDMLHEETTKEKIQSFYRNRNVIAVLSVLLVWLIMMIVYVIMELVNNALPNWLAFIYAIPLSFIVALVFNNLWGGRIYNMIIVSGLDWGVALSLVLSLGFIDSLKEKIWYLYFIAAIFEVMIILWYLLDFSKMKAIHPKAKTISPEEFQLAKEDDDKDKKPEEKVTLEEHKSEEPKKDA